MVEDLRLAARPGLEEALGWIGLRVDDVFGVTIGTVADVRSDPDSDEPRWLLVRGGRFGGHYTLVPFGDASVGTENVWVPYERATVRDAPTVAPTEALSRELDEQLEAHYTTARGEPAPPILTQSPRPEPEHAHRLGRSRAAARASATRADSDDGREVEVSRACVRIQGYGEVEGVPVEIELEGSFTGTIRRRI